MLYLVLGFAIFFSTHLFSAFRSREKGRDLRVKLGEGPYMGLYSLVALLGFVLIVYGYIEARPSQVIYAAPIWGRHLNYVLMPITLILLVAAYVPTGYIKRWAKHPMLAAVKVWAFGHLLANGELAAILLFGLFFAYAVVARIAAKRRGDVGPGPEATVRVTNDLIAVVLGLVVFAAITFYLHPILFGVAVWPPS